MSKKGLTSFNKFPFLIQSNHLYTESQKSRCKQRGIKLVTLQSSRVFDPRSIYTLFRSSLNKRPPDVQRRQMCMQACTLGSLLAGIKFAVIYLIVCQNLKLEVS